MTIVLPRVSRVILFFVGLVVGAGAQGAGENTELLDYDDTQWNPRIRVLVHSSTRWLPAGWQGEIRVPAPPGLAETLREVEFLLTLKSERPMQAQNIAVEDDYVGTRYFHLLGLNVSTHPRTTEFIDNLVEESLRVVLYFKSHYRRARPWQYDQRLVPIIAPPGHPAYPSGHSTQANTLSLVLSEMYPQRREELLKLGYEIARNREVGGVHYPSDSEAGRVLAEQIVAHLFQVDAFRAAFAAARAEY